MSLGKIAFWFEFAFFFIAVFLYWMKLSKFIGIENFTILKTYLILHLLYVPVVVISQE
jgi:hypothetical protein